MRTWKLVRLALALAVSGLWLSNDAIASEDPARDFLQKLMEGAKPTVDIRARYEHAGQHGRESSDAYTIRFRVGVLSGEVDDLPFVKKFRIFAEFEDTEVADRDDYNAAGVHGPAAKTVIADPENVELNRIWASFEAFDTAFKVGRQRIKLANDRFVGNVGWRQNEQTYDAVSLRNNSIENVELFYAYLWRVNRIFGSEVSSDSANADFDDTNAHLIEATFTGIENHKLKAYAWFLDLENNAGNNNSNNTIGASATGKFAVSDDVKLGYWAEYARQWDAASSTLDYRADYVHGKLWGEFGGGHQLGGGYEILGDDSSTAGTRPSFRTPLATLHAHNGFADRFLATPAVTTAGVGESGLVDTYAWIGLKLPAELNFKAIFHNFNSDHDTTDLGHEWDFVVSRKLPWKVTALAKYANFESESSTLASVHRFWFQLSYKY